MLETVMSRQQQMGTEFLREFYEKKKPFDFMLKKD